MVWRNGNEGGVGVGLRARGERGREKINIMDMKKNRAIRSVPLLPKGRAGKETRRSNKTRGRVGGRRGEVRRMGSRQAKGESEKKKNLPKGFISKKKNWRRSQDRRGGTNHGS